MKVFEPDSLMINALGSNAKLGDLYDARTDSFCGLSLLEQEVPSTYIKVRDTPFMETKLLSAHKPSDMLDYLEVKAELKLSILSGLVQPEGSGQYLLDQKSSARAARCSLMHTSRTKVEQLQIFNDEFLLFLDVSALEQKGATHAVVGIHWGSKLVVTLENANEDKEDVDKAAAILQAHVHNLVYPDVEAMEVDQPSPSVSLNCYGDLLPEGDLPKTIEGALELMNKIPLLLRDTNDGKGKPMEYVLVPISTLKSNFGLRVNPDTISQKLSEADINKFVQSFDMMNEAKQQLNDLCSDVGKYYFCLPDTTAKAVEELKLNTDITEDWIRQQVCTLLVELKAGRSDLTQLELLRQEYENHPYSAQNIMKILHDQFSEVRAKIDFCSLLTMNGVTLISKTESSLYEDLMEICGKDVYILFVVSRKAEKFVKDLQAEQLRFFLKLVKNPSLYRSGEGGTDGTQEAGFFYVDVDVTPNLAPPDATETVVRLFRDRRCVSVNVYIDYMKDREVNIAKSCDLVESGVKPNKWTKLEIVCPGSIRGICEAEVLLWKCSRCKADIKFGFDRHFYCKCGKGRVDTYAFRCADNNHGERFERFWSDEALLDLLGQLKPMKELNILILGETGVGKSTWINGIVNYLEYATLEDAEKNESLSVIPMSFSMTNDDYEAVIISTGEDANEDPGTGNSATQFPKSYTFINGDYFVRLIDTPGIGDVRGIAQDKENFKRILNHLSFVEEIHGICILLKPNNARLTVVFQFCIKELLTHLHRDASKNIVFCFTNSRSTFYRPGDTLPALKKLLRENREVEIPVSKDTMYCMDNEAIRFLAAIKHGAISFDETDRNNFSASWDKSVDETDRLFTHFAHLTPHKTKDTLSLNDARRLITELTKPLAEISKNIQDNISLVKDKEEEIKKIDATRADLNKFLRIPHVDLKNKPLGYPRTVCGNSKCVEIIQGLHGISHPVYSQVCHDNCGIGGVSTGMKRQVELMSCKAMTGLNENCRCVQCGCPWFEHMHQTYSTIKVDTFVVDPNVEEQLRDRANNMETIRDFVMTLQKKIAVLRSEQEVVTKVSAEFAAFLQYNAITPYNDVLAEYLDHLIQIEKDKVTVGKDRKTLHSLMEMKDQYLTEVRILQDSISLNPTPCTEITPRRIKELIQKLYDLVESGPKLRELMDVVTTANHDTATYYEADMVSNHSRHYSQSAEGMGKRTWRRWFPFH